MTDPSNPDAMHQLGGAYLLGANRADAGGADRLVSWIR
jgi:hypothetical protein